MEAWGECEQGGESGAYLKLSPLFVGTGVLDGPRYVKQNKPLRVVFELYQGSIREGAGAVGD